MSVTHQPNILRVSFEPHLAEKLRPLVHAIPASLSAELTPLLSETTSSSTPTISYAFLSSLSKWARTEEGTRELKSKDPPLDPLAYSMVALLAGTRTSPDKKFPQPSPSSRPESVARNISDKRAVIAVLNALLSVICTGAATWWAAQRTGWRDEWKVLLSLFAGTVVAISEVGLFIIWESRGRRSRPAVARKASHDSHSVGNANSGDAGEETSSKPGRLGDLLSQASTSVNARQSGETMALRQRVGTTSKSRSR